MKQRKRLHARLQELYPQYSRQQLQSWIMQGLVLVNDAVDAKAGTPVMEDACIRVNVEGTGLHLSPCSLFKLNVQAFGIDVRGMTALDAGLSTGWVC